MSHSKSYYENNTCEDVGLVNAEFPANKGGLRKENKQKKLIQCLIDARTLLVSTIIKNKELSYASIYSTAKARLLQSNSYRKSKNHRSRPKSFLQTTDKGGKNFTDEKQLVLTSRTVLCWLIDRDVISLNDLIQYRNSTDNAVVKEGLVRRNGILRNCCNRILCL